ncbi:MAG: alpha/beta hydrolase family protein [Candidatus Thorarchaeota archaeon]
MKRRNIIIICGFLLFFLLSQFLLIGKGKEQIKKKHTNEKNHQKIKQLFSYDKNRPINPTVIDRIEKPEFFREKILFFNGPNFQVYGYLAVPKIKSPPYPCVLQIHGLQGSKSDWWRDDAFMKGNLITKGLLSSGISVLALDARFYRKDKNEIFTFNTQELLPMFIDSTIDYRRAIDYLATRPEIDMSKVGVIGYSIGGVMTFVLSAVEPRIKAAAACVTPNLSRFPIFQNQRNKEVKNQLIGVNPFNLAGLIKNLPFLMLMGRFDSYCSEEEANHLYNLVESSQKKIIFYNRGHFLHNNYVSDAVKWFKKYLDE